MKKGDKIVCIKDFNNKIYSQRTRDLMDDLYLQWQKDKSELQPLLDEIEKESLTTTTEIRVVTAGKIYKIKDIFDGNVKIINDIGETTHLSLANEYSVHFITLIESRKRKLDELADENFSTFLKKIKK